MAPVATAAAVAIDLAASSIREVNRLLASPRAPRVLRITNPRGAHALVCGLDGGFDITIDGHVGYYCAGMNKHAAVTVNGNAGVGVAENMMSGTVRVTGDASQSAGATAHGGLLVIEGNAAARCGISLKGADIVVGGDIGHMSAFMAQAGRLVVCGNAGDALGDSLYEARIYVRGTVASLGADCVEKPMRTEHLVELKQLLDVAGFTADPRDFTRYGSARTLYNFHVDNASAY
jgi:methylamine---glutamate N-methyltransferase subunit B